MRTNYFDHYPANLTLIKTMSLTIFMLCLSIHRSVRRPLSPDNCSAVTMIKIFKCQSRQGSGIDSKVKAVVSSLVFLFFCINIIVISSWCAMTFKSKKCSYSHFVFSVRGDFMDNFDWSKKCHLLMISQSWSNYPHQNVSIRKSADLSVPGYRDTIPGQFFLLSSFVPGPIPHSTAVLCAFVSVPVWPKHVLST